MARKSLAICGLMLMVLFQFSKSIGFLECQLINFGDSKAACDCVNVAKDVPGDAQQTPAQKQPNDKSTDFFDLPIYKFAPHNYGEILSAFMHRFDTDLPAGFGEDILQPPRV